MNNLGLYDLLFSPETSELNIHKTNGKIFFIEVKSAKGKLRPDQIVFHKMLQSHTIVHGIARSVEDALMIVDGGLVGYDYD